MNDSDKQEFSNLMDATMPIYRMESSVATKRLWWNLLKAYSMEHVAIGFADHLRSSKFAPTPADIIAAIDKIIPDGRPGPNEAWAMMPQDEYGSVVMSDEMAQAMGIATPLLNEGNRIGARMAFIESYKRIVETNKSKGVKPKWFPSLGFSVEQREACLAEAVRLGRLTASHAISLLPPDKIYPMLQSAGEEKLALEHKPCDDGKVNSHIAQLKSVLK